MIDHVTSKYEHRITEMLRWQIAVSIVQVAAICSLGCGFVIHTIAILSGHSSATAIICVVLYPIIIMFNIATLRMGIKSILKNRATRVRDAVHVALSSNG